MAQLLHFVARRLYDTQRLARALSYIAKPGDVIALLGPVGVGKSAFATAFVRAMHSDRALLVPSPSFLLQQWYRAPGRVPVCHMDFFRMKSEDELRKLGLQEAAREGVLLIEWADKFPHALPAAPLHVTIARAPKSARTFDLSSADPSWAVRASSRGFLQRTEALPRRYKPAR